MVNEKRLIDFENARKSVMEILAGKVNTPTAVKVSVAMQEAIVDAVEVVHGKRLYNAHEVAEIIAELFEDSCACNFNGIDDWLPFKCELLDSCPYPAGVACWEQYLKFRDAKMDGERNDND